MDVDSIKTRVQQVWAGAHASAFLPRSQVMLTLLVHGEHLALVYFPVSKTRGAHIQVSSCLGSFREAPVLLPVMRGREGEEKTPKSSFHNIYITIYNIMFYTLNSYKVICQLYLDKNGKKVMASLHTTFFHNQV